MKVRITRDSERVITLADKWITDEIIGILRSENAKPYEQSIAHVASGTNSYFEILKFEAEIAKNRRICDRYFPGSADYDVWISMYAYNTFDGFYEIGCYLSDVWDICEDNHEEIKNHMYIGEYKRAVM